MMKVTLHFEPMDSSFDEYLDFYQYTKPSPDKLYNLCQQFELVRPHFTLDTVTLKYKEVSVTFVYEHHADLDAYQKQLEVLSDLLAHKYYASKNQSDA